MVAFCVSGNASGEGISLYMAERLKEYHHSPTTGSFEAKKYEGSERTFVPFIPSTMPMMYGGNGSHYSLLGSLERKLESGAYHAISSPLLMNNKLYSGSSYNRTLSSENTGVYR